MILTQFILARLARVYVSQCLAATGSIFLPIKTWKSRQLPGIAPAQRRHQTLRAPLIIRGALKVQDVPPFTNLCKRLVNEEKQKSHFSFSTLKIPGMEFLEVPLSRYISNDFALGNNA